jgi:trimethylamine:corrinoid methyltransferase-like protein
VSYYEVLSSQNIADIHEASLEVLHKSGFVIEHKVALKKLSDAGAQGKMQDILQNHHVPPLEEKVQTELDNIFQTAKAELC